MRNLLIQLALATVPALTGCTGSYVPTAAQPCPGLYCAQWTLEGVTVDVCENTQTALTVKLQSLQAKFPASVVH
jgi:hypothetical protein